jgi:hypothetical protein
VKFVVSGRAYQAPNQIVQLTNIPPHVLHQPGQQAHTGSTVDPTMGHGRLRVEALQIRFATKQDQRKGKHDLFVYKFCFQFAEVDGLLVSMVNFRVRTSLESSD